MASSNAQSTFRGLDTRDAVQRLSSSLRSVLDQDAARLGAEDSLERAHILKAHLLSARSIAVLLSATAFLVSFAIGSDSISLAYPSSLLTAAVFLLLGLALDAALVISRANALRWETHVTVTDALVEFERATGVEFKRDGVLSTADRADQSTRPAFGSQDKQNSQPHLVVHDGIVTASVGLWQALDWGAVGQGGSSSKLMHAVPVYRDGAWGRLPVALCVKGDLIALSYKETAPAAVKPVDGAIVGRRGSIGRLATLAERTAGAHHAGAGAPKGKQIKRHAQEAGVAEGTDAGTVRISARSSSPSHIPGARAGAPAVKGERVLGHNGALGSARIAPTMLSLSYSARERERAIDALTLCGDMRRFTLLDTPAEALLRRRLRAPPRPQPLFMATLRSFAHLGGWWTAGVFACTCLAVLGRGIATRSDVHSASSANGDWGAYVGLTRAILVQIPTLLIAASPLSLPLLLVLFELLGTARLLAVHEAALVRGKWKSWRRGVLLDALVLANAQKTSDSLASAAKAADEFVMARGAHASTPPLPRVSAEAVLHRAAAGASFITEGNVDEHQEAAVHGEDVLGGTAVMRTQLPQHTAIDVPHNTQRESSKMEGSAVFGTNKLPRSLSRACTACGRYAAACCFNPRTVRATNGGSTSASASSRFADFHDSSDESDDEDAEEDAEWEEGANGYDGQAQEHSDDEAEREGLGAGRPKASRARRMFTRLSGVKASTDERDASDMWGPVRDKRGGLGRLVRQLKPALASSNESALYAIERARPDVAGLDSRGEYLPAQYAGFRASSDANDDGTADVRYIRHGTSFVQGSLTSPVSLDGQGEPSIDLPSQLLQPSVTVQPPSFVRIARSALCCSMRAGQSMRLRLRRVFNGPSFEAISSSNYIDPMSERVWFYLLRLLSRRTRPVGMTGAKGAPLPHWTSANTILADDLVDVGFGLSPLPTPSLSSQLLLRLGTATVLTAGDRSVVCEPAPTVESVMMLKGTSGASILTLHPDETSASGLRFDDTKNASKHLASLKPLGLAAMVGAREASRQFPGTGGASRTIGTSMPGPIPVVPAQASSTDGLPAGEGTASSKPIHPIPTSTTPRIAVQSSRAGQLSLGSFVAVVAGVTVSPDIAAAGEPSLTSQGDDGEYTYGRTPSPAVQASEVHPNETATGSPSRGRRLDRSRRRARRRSPVAGEDATRDADSDYEYGHDSDARVGIKNVVDNIRSADVNLSNSATSEDVAPDTVSRRRRKQRRKRRESSVSQSSNSADSPLSRRSSSFETSTHSSSSASGRDSHASERSRRRRRRRSETDSDASTSSSSEYDSAVDANEAPHDDEEDLLFASEAEDAASAGSADGESRRRRYRPRAYRRRKAADVEEDSEDEDDDDDEEGDDEDEEESAGSGRSDASQEADTDTVSSDSSRRDRRRGRSGRKSRRLRDRRRRGDKYSESDESDDSSFGLGSGDEEDGERDAGVTNVSKPWVARKLDVVVEGNEEQDVELDVPAAATVPSLLLSSMEAHNDTVSAAINGKEEGGGLTITSPTDHLQGVHTAKKGNYRGKDKRRRHRHRSSSTDSVSTENSEIAKVPDEGATDAPLQRSDLEVNASSQRERERKRHATSSSSSSSRSTVSSSSHRKRRQRRRNKHKKKRRARKARSSSSSSSSTTVSAVTEPHKEPLDLDAMGGDGTPLGLLLRDDNDSGTLSASSSSSSSSSTGSSVSSKRHKRRHRRKESKRKGRKHAGHKSRPVGAEISRLPPVSGFPLYGSALFTEAAINTLGLSQPVEKQIDETNFVESAVDARDANLSREEESDFTGEQDKRYGQHHVLSSAGYRRRRDEGGVGSSPFIAASDPVDDLDLSLSLEDAVAPLFLAVHVQQDGSESAIAEDISSTGSPKSIATDSVGMQEFGVVSHTDRRELAPLFGGLLRSPKTVSSSGTGLALTPVLPQAALVAFDGLQSPTRSEVSFVSTASSVGMPMRLAVTEVKQQRKRDKMSGRRDGSGKGPAIAQSNLYRIALESQLGQVGGYRRPGPLTPVSHTDRSTVRVLSPANSPQLSTFAGDLISPASSRSSDSRPVGSPDSHDTTFEYRGDVAIPTRSRQVVRRGLETFLTAGIESEGLEQSEESNSLSLPKLSAKPAVLRGLLVHSTLAGDLFAFDARGIGRISSAPNRRRSFTAVPARRESVGLLRTLSVGRSVAYAPLPGDNDHGGPAATFASVVDEKSAESNGEGYESSHAELDDVQFSLRNFVVDTAGNEDRSATSDQERDDKRYRPDAAGETGSDEGRRSSLPSPTLVGLLRHLGTDAESKPLQSEGLAGANEEQLAHDMEVGFAMPFGDQEMLVFEGAAEAPVDRAAVDPYEDLGGPIPPLAHAKKKHAHSRHHHHHSHGQGRKAGADEMTGGTAKHGRVAIDGKVGRVNVARMLQDRLEAMARDEDASLRALASRVREVPMRTWLCPLASEIGFTPTDLSHFAHVRHVYTVVGRRAAGAALQGPGQNTVVTVENTPAGAVGAAPGSRRSAKQATLPTGNSNKAGVGVVGKQTTTSQARATALGSYARLKPGKTSGLVLTPALSAAVVRDTRTERLQMLSQGSVPFVLANCSNYWDGMQVSPLGPGRREALLSTFQQWASEDLDCVGVAYDPVSKSEADVFALLDEAVAAHQERLKGATELGRGFEDTAELELQAVLSNPKLGNDRSARRALMLQLGRCIGPSHIGLGFDAGHVLLLARDVKLNAQVDVRTRARSGDWLHAVYSYPTPGLSARPSESRHDGATYTDKGQDGGIGLRAPTGAAPATASVVPALPPSGAMTLVDVISALAAKCEANLLRMQSGQIFVGMVAARYQPQRRMQHTIRELHRGGVRFAYMASRSYRQTKPLAQKMGLETGWNCAISLMPRKPLRHRASASAATSVTGTISPVPTDGAGYGTREYNAGSAPASGAPGSRGMDRDGLTGIGFEATEAEAEEGEDYFGVEGVLSDEKRLRLLRAEVDEQLWDAKAKLPHGIPEIRTHLNEIDNVPLLVSLFTDATPPSAAGMMRVMQERGETVLVVASSLKRMAALLMNVADIGVSLSPDHPPPPAHGMALLTDEPYEKGAGSGPLHGLDGVARPTAVPLPLMHPFLRFATAFSSIHAGLTLPAGTPLHVLLRGLREARRAAAAMQSALALVIIAHATFACMVLVNVAAGGPPLLEPGHVLWLSWVIVPCLSLPLVLTPTEGGKHMGEGPQVVKGKGPSSTRPPDGPPRMPEKRVREWGDTYWDLLPGPSADVEYRTEEEREGGATGREEGRGEGEGGPPSSANLAPDDARQAPYPASDGGVEAQTADGGEIGGGEGEGGAGGGLIGEGVPTPQDGEGEDAEAGDDPDHDRLVEAGLVDEEGELTGGFGMATGGGCGAGEGEGEAEVVAHPLAQAMAAEERDREREREAAALELLLAEEVRSRAAAAEVGEGEGETGGPSPRKPSDDKERDRVNSRSSGREWSRRRTVSLGSGDSDSRSSSEGREKGRDSGRGWRSKSKSRSEARRTPGTRSSRSPSPSAPVVSPRPFGNDAMRPGGQELAVDTLSPPPLQMEPEEEVAVDGETLPSHLSQGITHAGIEGVGLTLQVPSSDFNLSPVPEAAGASSAPRPVEGRPSRKVTIMADLPSWGGNGAASSRAPVSRWPSSAMSAAAAAAAAATPIVRIKMGATGFDPKTGGVHAEGLIQYGGYAGDILTCAIAGHSVEVCDASARIAAAHATDASGDSSSSSYLLSDPRVQAIVAAGIPPGQGWLRTPPAAPIPDTWATWTVYVFLLALPAAAGLEYVHQRTVLHALQVAGATVLAPGLTTSVGLPLYPAFLPLGGDVRVGAQPMTASVALAQSFCLLLLVAWLACLSALLMYRAIPWRVHAPWRNKAWPWAVGTALALQMVHSHLLAVMLGGEGVVPSPFGPGIPWDSWIVGLAGVAGLTLLGSAVKAREGTAWTRRMKSLRLSFDTRLGMYSPR